MQFFSGGYLESYFALESIDDLRTMFVIFGAGYLALSAVIVLLNRHALALVLPDRLVVLSGMFYGAFGILIPLHSIRRVRQRVAS